MDSPRGRRRSAFFLRLGGWDLREDRPDHKYLSQFQRVNHVRDDRLERLILLQSAVHVLRVSKVIAGYASGASRRRGSRLLNFAKAVR